MLKTYSKLWGQNSKAEDIYIYSLENEYLKVEILNIGALIKKIELKSEKNRNKNIVISYETIKDYEKNPAYIGTIIGRNAGRIKNGVLNLANSKFVLSKNNGNNNLHGGLDSISHKIWKIEEKGDRLSCHIESPHLENGFPGNIKIQVDYILSGNTLILEYYAESDRQTYINLTNHSYFNLSGENTPIYEDILEINSDYILKIDKNSIPYELLNLKDSIFNFKKPKKIKEFFYGEDEQKNLANNGIDHPYILNKTKKSPVIIFNEKSGIKMEVETDNPAVVVYTANYFGDIDLTNHSGICFETQEVPNLFKDEKLNIAPTFTEFNKPYRRYTKFIFSEIK